MKDGVIVRLELQDGNKYYPLIVGDSFTKPFESSRVTGNIIGKDLVVNINCMIENSPELVDLNVSDLISVSIILPEKSVTKDPEHQYGAQFKLRENSTVKKL